MSLKEVAFMKNLIMQNYRRRMIYFILNFCVIVVVVLFLFQVEFDPFEDKQLLFSVICFSFFIQIMITYHMNENKYPWHIKKRQMTALREVYEGNGTFEELKNSPSLDEYFSILK